jgi:hypothetical protein
MAHTTRSGVEDLFKTELERLADLNWEMSPAVPQALRSLNTAMDYADRPLIRSHLNAVFEALRNLVQDHIRATRGRRQVAKDTWDKIWAILREHPCESYDEVGKEFGLICDDMLERLTRFREQAVRPLQEREYAIENAAELDREIDELQRFKKGILDDWPWSEWPLPSVNREMVAASRAAFARGEKGERLDDLIQRLGGDPTATTGERANSA